RGGRPPAFRKDSPAMSLHPSPWFAPGLLFCLVTFATAQEPAEGLSASFRKAAKRVLPAVVTVRALDADPPARLPIPRPGPGVRPGRGPLGPGASGVVIDAAKGYVLTNDHVVLGAAGVVVVLPDGRERTASQIRRDPRSDLALLTIAAEGLTAAEWGDSEALD